MSKKPIDIETTLRKAIADTGLTMQKLAKDSGVSQPILCRFVNRTRGITLPTAAKLARHLGLELKPKTKGKK